MTDVSQCRVVLTGSAVTGGGVSTFYTAGDAVALQSAVHELYLGLVHHFPSGVTATVAADGNVIDSNTGDVVGAWSGATTPGIAGFSADTYPKGVGARIVWGTNGFTRGRRVRGSTYLVPLAGNSYDTIGTLADAVRSALLGYVATFRASMGADQVILTRPDGATSGVEHSVTSHQIPDKVAWLSSRRD